MENKSVRYQRISFKDCLTIWSQDLWPHRVSAIEPLSAMTWPYSHNPDAIDMKIFDYEATFWGAYCGTDLVAVNSGHRTNATEYRSRGIWVMPALRNTGIAQTLFALTEHQARLEHCDMIWSLPRLTALRAYQRHGFETQGGIHTTETSDQNVYVSKVIA